MGNEYFKDILKFQQSLYDSMSAKNNNAESTDKDVKQCGLKVVFDLININFEQFHSPENQADLLPILHRALQGELTAQPETDIDEQLCNFVEQHKQNESEIKIVLQIIYQILQSLREFTPNENSEEERYNKNLPLGSEVFDKLIDLMFIEDFSRIVNTNVLTCLQLYVHQYAVSNLIVKLWHKVIEVSHDQQDISQLCVHIIVQLFDEFVLHVQDFLQNSQLVQFVQRLLLSGERDKRKSALFIMEKMVQALIAKVNSNVSEWGLGVTDELRQRWTTYIVVMENLEENQSHLILPSLAAYSSCDYSYPSWKMWSNILYKRILRHNNILVIRWALEHILKTFTCSQLHRDVLVCFLEATNNTSLYNLEEYFLPTEQVGNFLNCEFRPLVESLTQINWKAVPLHFWLHQIYLYQQSKMDDPCYRDMLLPIAARVRALQNPVIRMHAIKVVEKIFFKTIKEMTLNDYMVLIETLYNAMDCLDFNLDHYWCKLKQFCSVSENLCHQRFYKLIANNLSLNCWLPTSMLKYIPKERHGYLRFLIVFHSKHSEEIISFCRSKYDLDICALKEGTLLEMSKEFCDKLVHHKDEEFLVREKTVDFFVWHRVINLCFLTQYNLTVEELLDTGSPHTLLRLSNLLCYNDNELQQTVWKSFVQALQKDQASNNPFVISTVVEDLLKHIRRTSSLSTIRKRSEELLNIDLENVDIARTVVSFAFSLSTKAYVRGMMLGDPKTGDSRIEDRYQLNLCKKSNRFLQIRSCYIKGIREDYVDVVYKELLKLNREISCKKPRYYENSNAHRQKMRIVYAILSLMKLGSNFWTSELWNDLLDQNNQLNITYAFEFIIAKYAPNFDTIVDKLKQIAKYTARQQVSIICVAHGYCVLRSSSLPRDDLVCVINALLPSTMGANFQIRLYSQLVILSLLQQMRNASEEIRLVETAIKVVVGELAHLSEDIRLIMPDMFRNEFDIDAFMYITHAPYDEYNIHSNFRPYEDARAFFGKKICNYAKASPDAAEQSSDKKVDTTNVQRKMNPTSDVLLKSDLISYPATKTNEFYVVASLIDKLPNLGGIARTCEVMGIQNLILENKAYVEMSDFKTLSMTAEKGLNIIEVKKSALTDYFVQKQLEGFKIVGAEQTAESVCFTDFKFPKKCVLLLGHEKEGIPANLLGFLDYAVEIPQFGMVRSLNVHVTGALFMWEYCKQHIIGK